MEKSGLKWSKLSSVGRIKVDALFLLMLFFAVISPFAVYKWMSNTLELYTYGEPTAGVVVGSHSVKSSKRGTFGNYTPTTNIVYEVNYLGSHKIIFGVSDNESPPEKSDKINLLYSSRNPDLAIKDTGQDRSFWNILDSTAESVWIGVMFAVLIPLSWAYVISEIKTFIKNLKNVLGT